MLLCGVEFASSLWYRLSHVRQNQNGGMNLKKRLFSLCSGFIFISALALNANAQMCGCMGGSGGGMQGRMREGMEHQGVGMMHGMSDKPGGGMIMADDHPMRKHLMLLGLDEKQQESLLAQRYQAYRGEIQVTHEVI
jgi:hypothetical protein